MYVHRIFLLNDTASQVPFQKLKHRYMSWIQDMGSCMKMQQILSSRETAGAK